MTAYPRVPVCISCATDAELANMLDKHTYTEYWRGLIKTEIKRREAHESVPS